MELIRKSDALHAVLHNEGQAAVAAVQEIKAEDVAPVVRCRECLWRHDDSSPMWLPCMESKTPDDWYCADGERKEGAE